MKYPGRLIKSGERDADIVRAIKERLNRMLAIEGDSAHRLDPDNPHFGPHTKQVVKLFQARNVDSEGRPLKQDGQVGPITWAVLFGAASVPRLDRPRTALLREVLSVAAEAEANKVREVPKNSNRGPEVDMYLRCTGVPTGNAWCCAFVYWCFNEAAGSLGRDNPMVKTAGCLSHWNRAVARGAARVTKRDAIENPGLLRPGMVFIIDHGRGLGHTGLVERINGGVLTTIEGNTDASKGREGGGVYRLTRKIVEINKGFIDYSGT